jgi:hypothetical protein
MVLLAHRWLNSQAQRSKQQSRWESRVLILACHNVWALQLGGSGASQRTIMSLACLSRV